MSNRVDDLENQVAELQAAVNGLTEELVETKERVRQLEERARQLEERAETAETDAQPAAGPRPPAGAEVAAELEAGTRELAEASQSVDDSARGETTTRQGTHANVVKRKTARTSGGDSPAKSSGNGSEATKSETVADSDEQSSSDEEQSGDSDIIVA